MTGPPIRSPVPDRAHAGRSMKADWRHLAASPRLRWHQVRIGQCSGGFAEVQEGAPRKPGAGFAALSILELVTAKWPKIRPLIGSLYLRQPTQKRRHNPSLNRQSWRVEPSLQPEMRRKIRAARNRRRSHRLPRP